AFDGGAGFDVVRNTRDGRDIWLTDASFDGIEEIDGAGADIRVGRDGRLDLTGVTLSNVGALVGDRGGETILGTAGADRLVGGRGGDLMRGAGGDDVFELRSGEGAGDAFDGGAGFDVVRNTRDGRDIWLTDASFDGIEEIDGAGADIRVGRDGRLDLT
ncbi:hypothetical protein MN188_17520, partial [Aliiroseovarius sp. N1Y82]|nr:hypothetical protein [Aliiroseovarius subalbicans]